MDQNTRKQYLLFLYGEYENTDKIIELIALQISNFTSNDSYVKYNYGGSNAVMFFESEFSFYELRDYVHLILENICSQYFLMEKPKGLYAYMPAELKLNLFNLTEDNIKEKKNIEETKNEKNESKTMFDAFDNSNFSEEDMERMFVNITNKIRGGKEETPTIDEILDKISNKGIESLSLTERKILDEYSNNYN
jgi:hypothetical protein